MPIKFCYTAKDKDGHPVAGTAEAEDKEKALNKIQELRDQGLTDISIESAEVFEKEKPRVNVAAVAPLLQTPRDKFDDPAITAQKIEAEGIPVVMLPERSYQRPIPPAVDESLFAGQSVVIDPASKFRLSALTKLKAGTAVKDITGVTNYKLRKLPGLLFPFLLERDQVKEVEKDYHRVQIAEDRLRLLAAAKDSSLSFLDSEFRLLMQRDLSRFAAKHYEIRCVEMSGDLSVCLFTAADCAYLTDPALNVLAGWRIPAHEGWELKDGDRREAQDPEKMEAWRLFGLEPGASIEEIKKRYHELAKEHHPDLHPGDLRRSELMQEINNAHEMLTGEPSPPLSDRPFGSGRKDTIWEKKIGEVTLTEGIPITSSIMVGDARDWIYGAGLSDDGSRIYLGGFSGRVYQLTADGRLKRIWATPPDPFMPQSNPFVMGVRNEILSVRERGGYLHILSKQYLYVLQEDICLHTIHTGNAQVHWFPGGWLLQRDQQIRVYQDSGELSGELFLKNKVLQMAFKDGHLLLQTARELVDIYSGNDKDGNSAAGTAGVADKEKALNKNWELKEKGTKSLSVDSAEVIKEEVSTPSSKQKKCPCCGVEFAVMPVRRRKCIHCKEFVYVQKNRLITKKEYEKKKRIAADGNWAKLSLEFHELMKVGDWQGMGINSFQKALQLCKEKRDYFPTLQRSAEYALRDLKKNGVQRVRILGGGGCPACEKMKDTVYPIAIAMAEMPVPCKDCSFQLYKDSKAGWCRCLYVAEFK
ncbi:MAG: DnaJ domain-containing protein [Candidatus Omnitrophota bacterium]